ncbi:MAG: beta-propeller fold lactonase family protein [bacterium]
MNSANEKKRIAINSDLSGWKFRLPTVMLCLLSLLLSNGFGQTASFVSLNTDTDISVCITCSPDGAFIYAAGLNTIVVFQRQSDGTIKTIQVLNNDHQGAPPIRRVLDMVVSPDGRHLYAVDVDKRNILIFNRDMATGKIVLIESLQDEVFASQFATVPFVESSYHLLISSEGNHLYWLYSPAEDYARNIIAAFTRDHESGLLSKIQTIYNGDSRMQSQKIPNSIAISPDGKNLYGGGYNYSKLLIFSRDQVNGSINLVDTLQTYSRNIKQWYGSSVVVSSEGNNVYATNSDINWVFAFARESKSGSLSSVESFYHIHPHIVIVSPDDLHVYISHYGGNFAIYSKNPTTTQLTLTDNFILTGFGFQPPSGISFSRNGDAIYMTHYTGQTVLRRDSTTGKLAVLQNLKNSGGGTDRLYASRSVAVSPNGNFLYVAARLEDAGISVFSRHQDDGRLELLESHPLAEVDAMIMSPEGRHLYVSNTDEGIIVVFALDPTTGELEWVQARQDSMTPYVDKDWAGLMAFSPEAEHLYFNDTQRLLVYERDVKTGMITRRQELNWGGPGGEKLALAVSPDGRHVYWGGTNGFQRGYAVTLFVRNLLTGELTQMREQEFAGMRPSSAMQVSPDGYHVYAAVQAYDFWNDSAEMIAVFSRDAVSGELQLLEVMRQSGLYRCPDLLISQNGRDVYALIDDYYGDFGRLVIFERSLETGRLTQRQHFDSWRNGVYGLQEPRALALSPDAAYLYVADLNGIATFATGRSTSTEVVESDNDASLPHTTALHANYPNPFNPTTLIKYDLSKTVHVDLAIYDVLGHHVRTLTREMQKTGSHARAWDGKNEQGAPVASGIYFYRLKTEDSSHMRKMLLAR